MKIQINGFDIEILTDETTMTMKVVDATGKELSNNTFEQTTGDDVQVQPTDLPSAQGAVQPENTDQTQPVQPEEDKAEESLIPTLEAIKATK